jgi:folylpolyglutamate synthase/dihydrofolate synthase
MLTSIEQTKKEKNQSAGKTRNYSEVVEYLDSLKTYEYSEKSIQRMKQLDKLFNNPSSKLESILVGGTNGKSLTMHFASKILKQEGYKVGSAYSTHFLTYNERMMVDSQGISNKEFADTVNEVICAAEEKNINVTSFEVLTMASMLFFVAEKVDVAMFSVYYGGKFDATNILNPKIAAISRIAEDNRGIFNQDLDKMTLDALAINKPGCCFVSAEQSKIRLQKMKNWAEENNITWTMPIRKLATLPYLFEQLYGRIASLGERVAQIYVEDIKKKFSPFLRGNLLATQRGQRGRPTLAAKRDAELNPIKTLKGFWGEQFDLLKGRFELLDKEKPSILLDNASNLDAFSNLFLGIRLLHYRKPLKGLSLIIGINKAVKSLEAIKLIRYLLKKVSGQVFFVCLEGKELPFHSVSELVSHAKDLGFKAKSCKTFAEAFALAKATVDERDGLIVASGSHDMVSEYWKHRGIKKI